MADSPLKPLKALVTPKAKEPRLIINLEDALDTAANRDETVDTYIFTPTIKEQFLSVLNRLQERRGGGFWVQAEYGSGKTHFLGALAALLVDPRQELWKKVGDNEVRRRGELLGNLKLFPVVRSLRGEAQAEDGVARPQATLMRVLLRAFKSSLEQLKLRERILLTSDDDVLAWLKRQGKGTRSDISRYIEDKTGEALPDRPEDHSEGPGAVCAFVRRYWQEHGTPDPTPTSYKDRFTWIYRQLRGEGFDGLLILLDEFAFWQDMHPAGSQGAAHDEEILETLADVLPRIRVDNERMNITIVVASQKAPPAKLQERFTRLVLLADREPDRKGVREYDIIAAQRVRDLAKGCDPELKEFFNFYRDGFKFLRQTSFDDFRCIFPFHPRCFEYLRRVMERDMPTARSAIKVLWQLVKSASVLDEPRLLLPADLLATSEMRDLSKANTYKDSFKSYEDALRHFDALDLGRNKELGRRLLDTLFLIHLTYLEATRPTKAEDLAEMVAAQHEILRGADAVDTPLAQLHDGLDPVVTYKDAAALFKPTGRIEETPEAIFKAERKKMTDRTTIVEAWVEALTLTGADTMGHRMLFDGLTPDQPREWTVTHPDAPIEYEGEIVFVPSWANSKLALSQPPDSGGRHRRHFRLVFLAVKEDVSPSELTDDRIAVCVPAELKPDTVAHDAARDLATLKAMEQRYARDESDSGKRIAQWLRHDKRPQVMEDVASRQHSLYVNGVLVTRKGLGIEPKAVLQSRDLFAPLGKKVVQSAYDKLTQLVDAEHIKKPLKPGGVRQVFEAFALQEKVAGNASLASALTNYAVGLGLATQNRPQEFQPVNGKVFERLRAMMSEGAIETHKVFRELTRPPYGLTEELVTLYLLLFLRAGDPPAELRDFRSGTVTMKSGGLVPPSLHADNVFSIEWGRNLWASQNLGLLARRKEKQWNDVVPWGRCLVPDLETRNSQADVPPQERLLLHRLEELQRELPTVKGNLDELRKLFGRQLPPATEATLSAMDTISRAKSFLEFHSRAVAHHGEDLQQFRATVETYRRLKSLSDRTTAVQRIKPYVDHVVLPSSERDLASERAALQGQLTFDGLLSDPGRIEVLSEPFDSFVKRYEPLYQKHHRDVHKRREALQGRLLKTVEPLTALQQLNAITELGRAAGGHLPSDQQRLLQQVAVCPKAKENDGIVPVTSEPTCSCGLKLIDGTPDEAVDQHIQSLYEALKDKCAALRRELSDQALRSADRARLQPLLGLLRSGQVEGLPQALNPDLVAYLRQLLQEAGLHTVNVNILSKLPTDLQAVEEAQVPAAVQAFENALRDAFAEAKQQNPEARKIKISLK